MNDSLLKKVMGTFIPDEPDGVKPSCVKWAQQQCREVNLQRFINRFAKEQTEDLDPKMVVDSLTDENFVCRIPAKIHDHESSSPFRVDVVFTLNPLTGSVKRLD